MHDGYVKVFDKVGRVLNEGLIRNHSSCCTTWIGYYLNGNKKFTRDSLSQNIGWEVDYYENGQVKDSAFHINDFDSLYAFKKWYEDGKIQEVIEWDKDNKVRIGTKYFSNGGVEKWYPYNDGWINRQWYPNGQLHYEWINLQNGVVKEFYETGELKAIAQMRMKIPFESRTFDKDGTLTAYYKDGERIK